MKQKITRSVVIPALESTVEGKLRGGFSSVTQGRIHLRGGSNEDCYGNGSCFDNNICFGNDYCQGNPGVCGANGAITGTATSTSTSTSTSKLMANMFSLF